MACSRRLPGKARQPDRGCDGTPLSMLRARQVGRSPLKQAFPCDGAGGSRSCREEHPISGDGPPALRLGQVAEEGKRLDCRFQQGCTALLSRWFCVGHSHSLNRARMCIDRPIADVARDSSMARLISPGSAAFLLAVDPLLRECRSWQSQRRVPSPLPRPADTRARWGMSDRRAAAPRSVVRNGSSRFSEPWRSLRAPPFLAH